jgi:tetratricopeptide (TPR) repeat protein
VKRNLIECAVVAVIGAVVYSNTFHAPFTFDDIPQILSAHLVRDLAGCVAELPTGLRAVGRLTFAANYAVHGFEVPGYHFVNLLVHLCAALGVYALTRTALRTVEVTDRTTLSLASTAAAVLFVVHPVQTQAVTYIVQRYTSLATALYMASVVLYARSRSSPHRAGAVVQYCAALIAMLLAMRTKEIAFTLPLALVLYDVALLDGSARERLRRLAAPLLMLPVVPVIQFLLFAPDAGTSSASASIGAVARGGSAVSRLDYLLTQARVFMTYLRLLVLPISQNVDYEFALSRSVDAPVLLSALGVVILCGVGIWLVVVGRREGKPLMRVAGVGVLWFPLALSVESTLIPIRDVIAEHRLYLPSVGAFMVAGTALAALHRRARAHGEVRAAAVIAGFAMLTVVLGVATFQRNELWNDPVALWGDAVAKSPGKLRPILNLMGALRDKGDVTAARALYPRAIAIPPTDHEEFITVGLIFQDVGDLEAARSMWEAALNARPRSALASMFLGHLAWDRGDRVAARNYLERAVEADPMLAEAHLKLAVVLDAAGEPRRSLEELDAFTRYAGPGDSARVRQIQEIVRVRGGARATP